ncbi:DUF4760 domain-containing protein [Paracoccus marcusii]|jgi:hypothetical protein|uniref:DUF4760 domain-containing protein n=1 Tax=Paracoccus marcusii TaxID=59779 RepID=UPI00249092CD|nr:DUF4760 domain-containing protein [Paracoccus marcusii]
MSGTYLKGLLLLGILAFLGSFVALNSVLPINSAEPKVSISETGVQTWVIFGSIVVAFMALMVTSYHHDRTQKIQNTLATLQTIRTDRDYLDRARVIKSVLNDDLSKPISTEVLMVLLNAKSSFDDCDNCGNLHINSKSISFPEAVDFVLNQYEFIAGSARLGAADVQMISWAARSTILSLLNTFSPYIFMVRKDNPRIWANLVWLANEFDPGDWAIHKGKLGAPPPR